MWQNVNKNHFTYECLNDPNIKAPDCYACLPVVRKTATTFSDTG